MTKLGINNYVFIWAVMAVVVIALMIYIEVQNRKKLQK